MKILYVMMGVAVAAPITVLTVMIMKLKRKNVELLPFQIVSDVLEQYSKEKNIVMSMENINCIILDLFDLDYSSILIRNEVDEPLVMFQTNIDDRVVSSNLCMLDSYIDDGSDFSSCFSEGKSVVNTSDVALRYPTAVERNIKYAALFPLRLDDGREGYWLIENTSDFENSSKAVMGSFSKINMKSRLIKKNPETLIILKDAIEMLLNAGLSRYLDDLTGLPKREFIFQKIEGAIDEKKDFSIIFIDIDDFKSVNDTYGHDVGDVVLKKVSKALSSHSRQEDLIVRFGGEEIVAFIDGATIQNGAEVAERFRSEIEKLVFNEDLRVTASLGVASWKDDLNQNAQEASEIIKLADERLYQAKKTGKNRVICSVHSDEVKYE